MPPCCVMSSETPLSNCNCWLTWCTQPDLWKGHTKDFCSATTPPASGLSTCPAHGQTSAEHNKLMGQKMNYTKLHVCLLFTDWQTVFQAQVQLSNKLILKYTEYFNEAAIHLFTKHYINLGWKDYGSLWNLNHCLSEIDTDFDILPRCWKGSGFSDEEPW